MTGILIAIGLVAFAFVFGWLIALSLGSGNGGAWEDGNPDARPPSAWRGRD